MDTSRSPVARAGMALALAGTLVLGGSVGAPAGATTRAEESLLVLINKARVNHDRSKLRLSQPLSRRAHRHSARMAEAGSIFHHSCLSCLVSGWDWDVIGENVGMGESVRSVHRALMASSGHRRNILRRDFTRVGLGVIKSGGRVWITEIFLG